MFQPGQFVFINDPTHFPKIKQGEIDGPDPDWPGFWKVKTFSGFRWFHTSELEALPPPPPTTTAKAKPKRKRKPLHALLADDDPAAPIRTILLDNSVNPPTARFAIP